MIPQAEAALTAIWPGWRGRLTPLREGPETWVFRAQGTPEPAVVKLWSEPLAARAAAQAARQAEVAAALDTGPYRAPAVLRFDPDRRALIMQDAGGPDFCTRLETEAPGTVLADAGRWLRAFHDLTAEPRIFWPRGQVNWIKGLIAAVADGQRQPLDPQGFLAAARGLTGQRAMARGLPATRAVTHRDLTLANLVAGPGRTVWGIDFENVRADEPMRDVFSLALDALSRGVPEADLKALADAYADTRTAPQVRLFLQLCFAISVWVNTPPAPSHRQLAKWQAARHFLEAGRPLI